MRHSNKVIHRSSIYEGTFNKVNKVKVQKYFLTKVLLEILQYPEARKSGRAVSLSHSDEEKDMQSNRVK